MAELHRRARLLCCMSKGAGILACLLALSLSACGRQDRPSEEPAASTATPDDPDERSHVGLLGPVTYRYDPTVLTAANVQIAVPPAEEPGIYGFKLVPARDIAGTGNLCPGNRTACPIEDQPGLTMALLERPYTRYLDRLQESALAERIRPGAVGGVGGIALDLGEVEGLATQYRMVPVGERALLLKLQLDDEDPAEREAIEQVIETIALGE